MRIPIIVFVIVIWAHVFLRPPFKQKKVDDVKSPSLGQIKTYESKKEPLVESKITHPIKHRITGSSGTVWEHEDKNFLLEWVKQNDSVKTNNEECRTCPK